MGLTIQIKAVAAGNSATMSVYEVGGALMDEPTFQSAAQGGACLVAQGCSFDERTAAAIRAGGWQADATTGQIAPPVKAKAVKGPPEDKAIKPGQDK